MSDDKKPKISSIIKKAGIAKVAKKLDLSFNSVNTWVKLDKVPQRRVLRLAIAVDEDPMLIQSMVGKITYKPRRIMKKPADLDVVLAAYKGEPYEIKPPMTHRSLIKILTTLGDRVPLFVQIMKSMHNGSMTTQQAAKKWGVTLEAMYALRRRYGFPAILTKKKKEKILGPYLTTAVKMPRYITEVIEGATTVTTASAKYNIPNRTFSRYLAKALGNYTLKQLAHWTKSFRKAFAYEINKDLPRLVPHWVQKCEAQGWKAVKDGNLEPITDWRLVTTKRMLFSILNGELTVDELANLRGSEPVILHKLFDMELKHIGLTFSQVVKLSIWHQLAIMDMLRMSGKL